MLRFNVECFFFVFCFSLSGFCVVSIGKLSTPLSQYLRWQIQLWTYFVHYIILHTIRTTWEDVSFDSTTMGKCCTLNASHLTGTEMDSRKPIRAEIGFGEHSPDWPEINQRRYKVRRYRLIPRRRAQPINWKHSQYLSLARGWQTFKLITLK